MLSNWAVASFVSWGTGAGTCLVTDIAAGGQLPGNGWALGGACGGAASFRSTLGSIG